MLSLLIICQRIDDHLADVVRSAEAIGPQVLIGVSATGTESLGRRKNRLIGQAAHDWVLLLDTDETVSAGLRKEIKTAIKSAPEAIHGYTIPYQNYAFGRALKHGGERYGKVRLFRKQYGAVTDMPIHEEVVVTGKIGRFRGVIHHRSYRSIGQVLTKFTTYAWLASGELYKKKERVTFSKLFLYGPHMVWARAIKDEGWRDGWQGVVLALCFGYMEVLTYCMLLVRNARTQ